MRSLCWFNDICDDPFFLVFDGKEWVLDEDELNKLCCSMGNAGVTNVRMFPWWVWRPRPFGLKSQFAPYVLVDTPEGFKFNLCKFNDYYFPIYKKIIKTCLKYGMKTWFVLLDDCQFQPGYSKYSPWVTNVNDVQTAYSAKGHAFLFTFINRCIAEFKQLNVAYCWGNECNKEDFLEIVKQCIYDKIRTNNIVPKFSTYGCTMKECKIWGIDPETGKISYLCDNGIQDELKKDVGKEFGDAVKLAIWKEVHGIGRVEPDSLPPHRFHQAMTWWARKQNNGIRIWLADDGTHPRASGDRWVRIINVTKQYGNDFMYEHSYDDGETFEEAVQTFRKMHKAIFGKEPEKKYSYETTAEPAEPSVPPTPDVTNEEVKKPWWWWLFGSNSLISKALQIFKKIFIRS